jgi:hypothetical protein
MYKETCDEASLLSTPRTSLYVYICIYTAGEQQVRHEYKDTALRAATYCIENCNIKTPALRAASAA